MGYDVKVIEINEIETVNGIKHKEKILEELSMSYNFSYFKDDWYLPDEMNGQLGSIVANNINKVLNKYLADGHKVGIPDHSNNNWLYGLNNDANAPDNEKINHKKAVFMWFLTKFLEVANKYPDSYFINDYNSRAILTLKDGFELEINYFDN